MVIILDTSPKFLGRQISGSIFNVRLKYFQLYATKIYMGCMARTANMELNHTRRVTNIKHLAHKCDGHKKLCN